jgi:hypothetical protein
MAGKSVILQPLPSVSLGLWRSAQAIFPLPWTNIEVRVTNFFRFAAFAARPKGTSHGTDLYFEAPNNLPYILVSKPCIFTKKACHNLSLFRVKLRSS